MHVLSLDEGTTSARALLFDKNLSVVNCAQREIAQQYPSAGWVEEDPEEIWLAQREVLAQITKSGQAFAAIGIANQRETTIVWDRQSGAAIYPAIVWQDRRTADQCQAINSGQLAGIPSAARIRELTGLVVDPYFSATKIAWILDHVPDARRRAEAGELAFGTIDSWLIWKLTNGRHHVTDASNASRTLLFDLERGDWSDELLAAFSVPRALLPRIIDSSQNEGIVVEIPECQGVPICGVAGDQQAALFGQGCFESGLSKCTFGTGCFLLQNVGAAPVAGSAGILTTVAWRLAGKQTFALEGSVFIGGAVVQWLRDGLGIISQAAESEVLASSVTDTGGVHFVPAFTGLGAPHWDPHARGMISGITRGTTAAHITRAALESIGFQVAELVAAMNSCLPNGRELLAVSTLKADGGAAKNNLLMQWQADILGLSVEVPVESEATAIGAAALAGLAVGVWSSLTELKSKIGARASTRYLPRLAQTEIAQRLAGWNDAVSRVKARGEGHVCGGSSL